MRRAVEAQAGRLLRVLLLRLGAMPAGSSSRLLLMTGTLHTVPRTARRLPRHLRSPGGGPVEGADHSRSVTLPQNSASSGPNDPGSFIRIEGGFCCQSFGTDPQFRLDAEMAAAAVVAPNSATVSTMANPAPGRFVGSSSAGTRPRSE